MNKSSAILLSAITFMGGLALGHILGTRDKGASVEAPSDVAAVAGVAAPGAAEIVRYQLPVTADQPSKGPADALVTIVEFSEFQCPFCARVLPTTKQIQDEYGSKVRIVWRNSPLPFHNNADPAAQLAVEAFKQKGNDGFWKLHDILFANQQALERESLESYAKQVGLDMGKVKLALDNKVHAASIKADLEIGAQFGARGTPNFFVNGRQVTGARPFADFKTIIDEEIATAEAMLKKGVSKSQLYAAITKDGLTKFKAAEQPAAPGQPDAATVYKIELTGKEPQKGSNDALVTIVEISDFQCPFCSRVGPTMKQVEEKYGKDVRIVWWNNPLPFHDHAREAANAAMEAFAQKGNAGFWKMHDMLFENQAALSKEAIAGFGKKIGLNVAKLSAAMESGAYNAGIDAQQATARKFGAGGTPAFFVNGRNLRGAQPFPAFEALINEELEKAKKLVASGVSKGDVYKKSIEKGLTGVAAAAPQAPQAAAPDANKKYEIPVAAGAPFKGGANAKVVIQQFSDYQCPFCSRVEPTVDEIVKTYGDKVKIVWRDYPLPFHPNAHPAAEAGREVFAQGGNAKFWKFHKKLFENQQALTRENLEKWAQEVGVDMGKFKAALDQGKHKVAVDQDIAAVAKAGAQIGTPSFFINGTLVQGAVPFPMFKTAIDAALQ